MIGTFPRRGFPEDAFPEDSFPSSSPTVRKGAMTVAHALALTHAVSMSTELAVGFVSVANDYVGSVAVSDD